MMKFSFFSTEMVAVLLDHMAEHENFSSLKNFQDLNVSEVKETLAEIANQLRDGSASDSMVRRTQLQNHDFTLATSQTISKLSPREEEVLLKSFKIS